MLYANTYLYSRYFPKRKFVVKLHRSKKKTIQNMNANTP